MRLKLVLKTVQELMLEGFTFNDNGILYKDDSEFVGSKELSILGCTLEVEADDTMFENDEYKHGGVEIYGFMIKEKNEIKEDEVEIVGMPEYDFEDHFNFYLSNNGTLHFTLKASHDDLLNAASTALKRVKMG